MRGAGRGRCEWKSILTALSTAALPHDKSAPLAPHPPTGCEQIPPLSQRDTVENRLIVRKDSDFKECIILILFGKNVSKNLFKTIDNVTCKRLLLLPILNQLCAPKQ